MFLGVCTLLGGCHTYRDVRFEVRDFHSGEPIANIDLESKYPGKFPDIFFLPEGDQGVTDANGMLTLRLANTRRWVRIGTPMSWTNRDENGRRQWIPYEPDYNFHTPGALILSDDYTTTVSEADPWFSLFWDYGVRDLSELDGTPLIVLVSTQRMIEFDQSTHWFYGDPPTD